MDKRFLVIMTALVITFVGLFIALSKKNPAQPILGVSYPEQSVNHIQEGQPHEPYNSDPPSSGPHYAGASAPISWGVYTQEVPAEVFLHNEEHGGVIITYKPDLPADQIKKLQRLFAPPYSRPNFKPTKAILTPRAANKSPIGMASWKYTLNLDKFDEEKIVNFYRQHVSKSPEPTGGPYNEPIDQSKQ